MKLPKRKTLRAERETLVTYADAFALFKARGLCSTMRTVRTHIHNHPEICPVDVTNLSYHYKRFKLRDVEALVEHIAKKYPSRTAYATVTDTAAAALAVITKGKAKR